MITKFEDYIKESSEFSFNQFSTGGLGNPLGMGYGFATDPSLSIYSNDNSPYMDMYSRSAGTTSHLMQIIKSVTADMGNSHLFDRRADRFLEEMDDYKNIKILRIFENEVFKLNVYISFDFMGEEFFGVYRNFDSTLNKPTLESELLKDPRFTHIDKEYYLKLNNYIYKKLTNFFIPEPGLYTNLKKNNIVKDEDMGNILYLKEGKLVEVLGYNTDENNAPFIVLKIGDKKFNITGKDYYYFKWRFEETNNKM